MRHDEHYVEALVNSAGAPVGRLVDIELLDHVIIGRIGADPTARGFFSFREAGLL